MSRGMISEVCYQELSKISPRFGILGHQIDKRLKYFIHSFHNLSTCGFLKNSGFENTFKKSAKQENSILLVKCILYRKENEGRNQAKTRV
jgi:hypothetical protein